MDDDDAYQFLFDTIMRTDEVRQRQYNFVKNDQHPQQMKNGFFNHHPQQI